MGHIGRHTRFRGEDKRLNRPGGQRRRYKAWRNQGADGNRDVISEPLPQTRGKTVALCSRARKQKGGSAGLYGHGAGVTCNKTLWQRA